MEFKVANSEPQNTNNDQGQTMTKTKPINGEQKLQMTAAHGDPSPNLQPDAVKFGDHTLIRGDEVHSKKLLADAREAKEIADKQGVKHPTDSPKGKGLMAEYKALGEGNTPRISEAYGKQIEAQAERMAKVNAILKNQGREPITGTKGASDPGARSR